METTEKTIWINLPEDEKLTILIDILPHLKEWAFLHDYS